MKVELTGKNKYKGGMSTLEVLIAFAVLVLCIGAVILVTFGNQSVAIDSQLNNEAIYKAKKMLEDLRAESRFDFALVNPKNETELSGPLTFTKNIEVRQVDLFTKQATSTVSWQSEGRTLSVFFSTFLTNPEAVNGGTTCSSILSGNWTNPEPLGDVDFGQNNGATDVDVFMQKAYATADPTATNKEDFYIIDVSNPNLSPLPILGAINTGPGTEALHVVGKYAYVANRSRLGQLQIIDINDSANPVQVATTTLINVTGTGAQALGNSIC